jgi:hypothetical protein
MLPARSQETKEKEQGISYDGPATDAALLAIIIHETPLQNAAV